MFLAVDKPQWITSYDVIRRLKKLFPRKTKIGHSGTLDPMATWLLIIAVYKDTKRLQEFLGADKCYETTIDFSKMSDTWDMEYWEKYEEYVVDNNEVVIDGVRQSTPSLEQLKEKLDTIIPSATLPLTPFSAKKKNGKKLYELARAGVEVNESREMVVHNYEIVSYDFPLLKVKLDVGSGTYIRSIGYWLGQEFDLGGILTSLRRTKVADVDISALRLDQELEGVSYAEIFI